MLAHLSAIEKDLIESPRVWLVTGAAGFIGSHLVEHLLRLGQKVRAIDNFSTGKRENIAALGKAFDFEEGDINDSTLIAKLCKDVDLVLHQAAIGSVPRSIANPLETNRANVDGFLSVLTAAKESGVKRFVYASSSSVYGSDPSLPKREEVIGEQLSPYAVSKYVNELYARTFSHVYQIETVGLRYFNVFGPRQDPESMYAAVIPRWTVSLLQKQECTIFGDGETSRDFCYVDNVVTANLLAAHQPLTAKSIVSNVAVGSRTTLTQLYNLIADALVKAGSLTEVPSPRYAEFRQGDVRHSQADLTHARSTLGYVPLTDIQSGIVKTARWYLDRYKK